MPKMDINFIIKIFTSWYVLYFVFTSIDTSYHKYFLCKNKVILVIGIP